MRYLERVEQHDSAQWREAAMRLGLELVSDGDLLDFAATYTGINLEAARQRMLKRALVSALGCGASGCSIDGFVYVLKNGCVITVRPAQPSNVVKRKPDRVQARRPELKLNWLREADL